VNAAIARTVILGFVQEKYPQLLRSEGGQSPKVSLHTVRRFVRRELNWVVRAGTKASQKLAADWQLQCEKTFFRLVYAVANHKIHPSLIVNCDQTGVVLVPGGSQRTYEEKGAKQVSLHGRKTRLHLCARDCYERNGPPNAVCTQGKNRSLFTRAVCLQHLKRTRPSNREGAPLCSKSNQTLEQSRNNAKMVHRCTFPLSREDDSTA
jgi:hypothetical protein